MFLRWMISPSWSVKTKAYRGLKSIWFDENSIRKQRRGMLVTPCAVWRFPYLTTRPRSHNRFTSSRYGRGHRHRILYLTLCQIHHVTHKVSSL